MSALSGIDIALWDLKGISPPLKITRRDTNSDEPH